MMNMNMNDDDDAELETLGARSDRGELSEAERLRYAQLFDRKLQGLAQSIRRARAPFVAELDQMTAASAAMTARLEALGEAGALDDMSEGAKLATTLVRAAELLVLHAGRLWTRPELDGFRERLEELEDAFESGDEEAEELEREEREEERQLEEARRKVEALKRRR
jgi:hypothetical protein